MCYRVVPRFILLLVVTIAIVITAFLLDGLKHNTHAAATAFAATAAAPPAATACYSVPLTSAAKNVAQRERRCVATPTSDATDWMRTTASAAAAAAATTAVVKNIARR
jgi:hypothetical protein